MLAGLFEVGLIRGKSGKKRLATKGGDKMANEVSIVKTGFYCQRENCGGGDIVRRHECIGDRHQIDYYCDVCRIEYEERRLPFPFSFLSKFFPKFVIAKKMAV